MTIENGTVTRHIFLFRKVVHERKVSAEYIKEIRFRRAGWMRKRAVIVPREGRNIHVGQAKNEVMEHLESFAEHHEIPRDYAIEYKWL